MTAPVVSVSSRVVRILRSLRKGTLHTVKDLVSSSKSKSELVATFLGLLELIKAKRITVGSGGEIKTAKETA